MRNIHLKTLGYGAAFFLPKPNIQKITVPFMKLTTSRAFAHHINSSPITGLGITSQRLYCGCLVNGQRNDVRNSSLHMLSATHRSSSTSSNPEKENPEQKPSLYQRFKTMYKEYWYVLLPVHLVTSAGWFGGFYYMASSGFDIVAMLELLNVSDKLIEPFRNGHAKAGYLAVAIALYKVATPLRYTVTLGGTTVSINYLRRWGMIKPVPSTERLKELYQDRKGQIIEKSQTLKDNVIKTLKPTENS